LTLIRVSHILLTLNPILNSYKIIMATDPSVPKVIIREYAPNEPVITEGSGNDRFYVVLQGKIEIYHSNKKIRILNDGDVLGIEYYYLESPYSITATAVTQSRIASYHISMVREIIYDHPRLSHQIMASLAKQIEQTTLFLSKILRTETSVELIKTNMPLVHKINTENDSDNFNFQNDILESFIMESRELLDELYTLGDSLKLVGIPNDAETAILMEFAQKLNRLIGGTASIGFEGFARLSRKTSLLATKCGEIKGMTLRIIIKNLNLVISVLSNCFNDLESIKAAEEKIPDIELKIDICMTSIGIEEPELKTQEQIDEMFDEMKKEKA